MVSSSTVRQASGIWWTCSLSLTLCLGAGIGGLGAQECLQVNPAASREAEIHLIPAPGEISVLTGDPLDEVTAGLPAPLIGYLIEELIARRLVNAQLSADLAEARAERAEIEETVREKEAALVAWIARLHDELAQHQARLADVTAAGAGAQALFQEQAGAGAQPQTRPAAMNDPLRERDRQVAAARSETGDLRQRLDVAYAELERKGAGDDRLAAELAAFRMTTHSATVIPQENPAAIDDQIGLLLGAGRDTPPERPAQPAELLSTTSVDMLPVMPHLKPRVRAGEVEASAPASDTADAGAPAPTEALAMVEDRAWGQAGLLEAAVSNWEPITDPTPFSAPDDPQIREIVFKAAHPQTSGIAASDESGATEGMAGRLERGDRWGLNEAVVRLANGLRGTREEALLQRKERVFTVDVEERAFAADSTAEPLPLDPALSIQLFTAESELVGESRGGIRFFPDGSSTGGRIELELLGDRAAVNVQWSNGVVTVEP